MKKIISLFLLIATTLTGAAVQAQSCNPVQQPCYNMPCCQAASCDESGVYVSAFGGANWLNQHKKHDIKSKFDTGYTSGAALGYRFNRNFRAEAEVAYRNNHLDELKGNGCKDHPKGYKDSISFMANGYYDFDLDACFTPYVGLGVGYTNAKAHFSHEDYHLRGTSDGIAGQVIVGVSTRIYQNTDLGLEYRYFVARSHFHEQGVNLSLRYAF
jgi:outer membrane autotransporter protein